MKRSAQVTLLALLVMTGCARAQTEVERLRDELQHTKYLLEISREGNRKWEALAMFNIRICEVQKPGKEMQDIFKRTMTEYDFLPKAIPGLP